MKTREHRDALQLLEQHPGWSDRRVARLLGVAASTIGRWRWQAGLAPALKNVHGRRRRGKLTA